MKLPESIRHFAIVSIFESRIARRGIAFRVFAVMAAVLVFYLQAPNSASFGHVHNVWQFTALPAFVPLVYAFLFNAVQTVLVVLLVADAMLKERKVETRGVLQARPVGNIPFNAGKVGGIILAVAQFDVVMVALTMFFHLTFVLGPFDAWLYLFYLLTLTLPTLVFTAGVAAAIATITRGRMATLLIALPALVLLYITQKGNALDLFAVGLDDVPSPAVGLPAAVAYLLQRGAFLFAGVGMILLSAAGGRLPGFPRERPAILYTGCAFLLCAAAAVFAREAGVVGDIEARREFREAAARYAGKAPVTLARADIRLEFDNSKPRGVAALTLVNGGKERIDTIVLHLNPALEVETAEREGVAIPYRRDEQVLLINTPVEAGDSAVITVRYAGEIDERVARLDVDEQRWRAPENTYFNLGKRLAFLQEEYILLIPDVLWYPSPPVANPTVKTRFLLEVKPPAGLVPVSQGERRENGDGSVSFTPDRPVSGITLAAGKFARGSATMPEGYTIDVYYLENNHLVRNYLDTVSQQAAARTAAAFFGTASDEIVYPFKHLALVEAPASFAFLPRHDENRNDYIQPALVFWPEEGVRIINGPFPNPPPLENMNTNQFLRPWMYILYSNGYSLSSLFTEHGYTIHSDDFPALDRVWRTSMFRLRTFPYGKTLMDGDAGDQLRARSLGEIFRDPSLHPATRRRIATIKGEMLFRHLLLNTTLADLYRLHHQLEERFPARVVEFDTFADALQEITGEDPRPFIREWHDVVGSLPEFIIRDTRKETFFVEGEPWQRAIFKIHNRGKATGIIQTAFNYKGEESESFVIDPGAYKEIRVANRGKIVVLTIDFGQSLNRPSAALFSCENESASIDTSMRSVRDIDSSAFAPPPPGTIIVDNSDEGFRVIEPLPWIERFRSRKGGVNPNRWHELRREMAYGDGTQSHHRRYAGTGKSRVEWTANIQEEGAYDLHVFSSYQIPFPYQGIRESIYHYTVTMPGEAPVEIPLQLYKSEERWVLLGRFHVTPGACTVSLSDRAELSPDFIAEIPPEMRPFAAILSDEIEVHADAIRWTRVETP
ncbi:MAG: hypothetical protein LBI96_07760 [Odoribacteraceae bacterium]|jgi:hypothetical protein|nr:hypothetical protein [Odoribacteraceae bacterium]